MTVNHNPQGKNQLKGQSTSNCSSVFGNASGFLSSSGGGVHVTEPFGHPPKMTLAGDLLGGSLCERKEMDICWGIPCTGSIEGCESGAGRAKARGARKAPWRLRPGSIFVPTRDPCDAEAWNIPRCAGGVPYPNGVESAFRKGRVTDRVSADPARREPRKTD